jgi:hypothetical protein
MALQDGGTCGDAGVTDIGGRAGNKAAHVVARNAAA